MASASIISIAAGTTPAPMIAETASPPASIEPNAASRVCTVSGSLVSRTVTLVVMPRVPSEPTKAPSRSYPAPSLVSSTISPSGQTISQARTWWEVKPYFRQCAPPEFSATFPPIEQICWLEGSGAK